MRKGYAIGTVERLQIDAPEADAGAYGHDGTQQLAMLARIETGQRQLVPALLLAQMAHVPYHIIVGRSTEPCLQHVTYAEALALPAQQAPCALQLAPELHKAILIIFDFDHFDLDIFNIETAHTRQLMQASLLSLNRSLDHYDTFL